MFHFNFGYRGASIYNSKYFKFVVIVWMSHFLLQLICHLLYGFLFGMLDKTRRLSIQNPKKMNETESTYTKSSIMKLFCTLNKKLSVAVAVVVNEQVQKWGIKVLSTEEQFAIYHFKSFKTFHRVHEQSGQTTIYNALSFIWWEIFRSNQLNSYKWCSRAVGCSLSTFTSAFKSCHRNVQPKQLKFK